MTKKSLLLFFLLPFIYSCLAKQSADGKLDIDHLPPQFSVAEGIPARSTEWWRDLGSVELNTLMANALNDNFSVREAYARLTQAHYTALKAGAAEWPTLSANAGVGHTDSRSTTTPDLNTDNWLLGFSASYEVDLWGRVQAEKARESLLANASAADAKAALLSVSGQIAENWIALISTRRQQHLFEQQLTLQQELLHLILLRFPLAKATALDIYQQQQFIEKIKASLIPLTSKEKTLKRQLAFLLGKASIDNTQLQADAFPALPQLPGVGLPSDLLIQRPDVLAAGLRLAASQQDISVAKADLLPSLKLTASNTYSSNVLSSLFDNWLRNLAANMVVPLLDGNRRQNEVERTKALVEERLAIYGRTVFSAIREVEDALGDEQQQNDSITSLKLQQELSNVTIREARRRYMNGNSDFTNVLRSELN
ncbi:MAG: efflux transporter outer membrane subunit, partial [Desulfobulbaceae bacterium]|nr:efflux transporter outer membrane subunit [Desulfobulbaceae bacterium]